MKFIRFMSGGGGCYFFFYCCGRGIRMFELCDYFPFREPAFMRGGGEMFTV